MITKDRFEDRLLTELQQHAANRTADAPAPGRRPGTAGRRTLARLAGHRPVRRLAIGVTLAAALGVTAAVGVPALRGGGQGTPAYAVERNPDGTLTVRINEFHDLDGLARRLTRLGVPTHATDLVAGQTCAPGRYRRAPADWNALVTRRQPDHRQPADLIIHPDQLRPGESLVLMAAQLRHMPPDPASDGGSGEGWWQVSAAPAGSPKASQHFSPVFVMRDGTGYYQMSINIATGPVGPCRPVPLTGQTR